MPSTSIRYSIQGAAAENKTEGEGAFADSAVTVSPAVHVREIPQPDPAYKQIDEPKGFTGIDVVVPKDAALCEWCRIWKSMFQNLAPGMSLGYNDTKDFRIIETEERGWPIFIVRENGEAKKEIKGFNGTVEAFNAILHEHPKWKERQRTPKKTKAIKVKNIVHRAGDDLFTPPAAPPSHCKGSEQLGRDPARRDGIADAEGRDLGGQFLDGFDTGLSQAFLATQQCSLFETGALTKYSNTSTRSTLAYMPDP